MNSPIFRGCKAKGHNSVDFISKSVQLLKYAKPDVPASEQHAERAANSFSDELGGFDSDTSIFPWSSYRALPHFFLRPKIELVIDHYRREQWKRDVPLIQRDVLSQVRQPYGNLRQVTIVAFNRGGRPVEKASVHVHVVKEGEQPSLSHNLEMYLLRRWDLLPDVKVAWDKEPDQLVIPSPLPSELDVSRMIRSAIYSEYKLPIESRYEQVAVVAFVVQVQGHVSAYLSDTKATPLLMGRDHSLLITVSGRNMTSTLPRRYTLSLIDWDHLSLKPV